MPDIQELQRIYNERSRCRASRRELQRAPIRDARECPLCHTAVQDFLAGMHWNTFARTRPMASENGMVELDRPLSPFFQSNDNSRGRNQSGCGGALKKMRPRSSTDVEYGLSRDNPRF